jgi:hypothetical protein
MSEKVNENKRDTMTVLKPCKHEQGYCSGACEVEKVKAEKLANISKTDSEYLLDFDTVRYFDTPQAARHLGVSTKCILYYREKKGLKFKMYKGKYLFEKEDIENLRLKIRKSV